VAIFFQAERNTFQVAVFEGDAVQWALMLSRLRQSARRPSGPELLRLLFHFFFATD